MRHDMLTPCVLTRAAVVCEDVLVLLRPIPVHATVDHLGTREMHKKG